MEKVLGSPLELSATILFTFDKYPLKIWVENSVSAIQHIGNRKRLLGASPPLIKLILLHTVVALHYIHHIKMSCLIKGCQNAQRQIIIKAH